MQARCFAHFTSIFDELIARDKSEGKYDDGVVDLRASSIQLKGNPIPFYTEPTTKARTTLYTISVDRGMDWEKAIAELDAANAREAAAGNTTHINGFYEERQASIAEGRKKQYLLIRKQHQYGESMLNSAYETYRVITPNFGLTWFESKLSIESGRPIRHKLDTDVGKAKAQRLWTSLFNDTKKCCHFQVRARLSLTSALAAPLLCCCAPRPRSLLGIDDLFALGTDCTYAHAFG